jgi:hypothetical protein
VQVVRASASASPGRSSRLTPGNAEGGVCVVTICNLLVAYLPDRTHTRRHANRPGPHRWHSYSIDPAVDYSHETPTLVTFTLEPAPGDATRRTVVESGFDHVPTGRGLAAFRMNSRGWDAQMSNLAGHVGDQAHRADHS